MATIPPLLLSLPGRATRTAPFPPHRRPRLLGVAVCLAWGCAGRIPAPMTASQEVDRPAGDALVAYLAQPRASAAVCDARRPEYRPEWFGQGGRAALDSAFRGGDLDPALWRRCAEALLRGGEPLLAAAVAADVAGAARLLIEDPHLDVSGPRKARAQALLQAYAQRPPAVLVSPPAVFALTRSLRERLADRGRTGFGARYAADFLVVTELELGHWQGRDVGDAVLDELAAAPEERTLWWAALRLPDAALRVGAQRRLVRGRLQASGFPEVLEDPSAVEALVISTGRNALSLASHPPVRAWLRDPSVPDFTVLVEQARRGRAARLLAGVRPGAAAGLIPEVQLRGVLFFEVPGIAAPVTVCAPPEDFAVDPCVSASALSFGNLASTVSEGGELRLKETLPTAELLAIAKGRGRAEVPVSLEGRPLLTLSWKLSFLKPDDLLLGGDGPDGVGPKLEVFVDARSPDVLVYTVTKGGVTEDLVVERADARAFLVVSQGRTGSAGRDGSHGWCGSNGSDGRRAFCPWSWATNGENGSDGGNGQNGDNGQSGSDGGPVHVTVNAAKEEIGALLQVLRTTVLSRGGEGGSGGRGGTGGSGGRGGQGGPGCACSHGDLPRGRDGDSGRDGAHGLPGAHGRSGQAGRVEFSVEAGGG